MAELLCKRAKLHEIKELELAFAWLPFLFWMIQEDEDDDDFPVGLFLAVVGHAVLRRIPRAVSRKGGDGSLRVSFDGYTPLQFQSSFRFRTQEDIERLARALCVPEKYDLGYGHSCHGIDALAVLLARLSFPSRYATLQRGLVEWPVAKFSMAFNAIMNDLYARYKDKIAFDQQLFLDAPRYSECIKEAGAPAAPDVMGFIDGTLMAIAAPTGLSKASYTNHKKIHALKYQGVVAPNGLFMSFFGPSPGTHHDSKVFYNSELQSRLNDVQVPDQYVLYGDSAYPWGPRIRRPFKGMLTNNKKVCNRQWSEHRVCVEWAFGKMWSLWSFLDFKKNLKARLQPVGKYCVVACLLTNCHTCLYGSETSLKYACNPPLLEHYLGNE